MEFLAGAAGYVIPFLLVLTALVFVHELGHYAVARYHGVAVEVFSIGFGRELFGFTDRHGTRWKFSLIPLGGYVRMLGDADPSGMRTRELPEAQRTRAFPSKSLGQRAAIVAAGPIANYLFAIVVLALLFASYGLHVASTEVSGVQPGSAAEEAGLRPGDRILAVDGEEVERFQRLQQLVMLNTGSPMRLMVEREGGTVEIEVIPRLVEGTDAEGRPYRLFRLGLESGTIEHRSFGPVEAVGEAVAEVYRFTTGTLRALGQMVSGRRGTEEIGGVLRIAETSGEAAQAGIVPLLWFTALLSVNLGLLNLLPVPLLDGGHLLFYAIEAIWRRPLGPKAKEYGFRLGFALVFTLMVVATWNDLVQLRIIEFFRQFGS